MIEINKDKICIDINEDMTPENLSRVSNLINEKIQIFKNQYGKCSRCDEYFDLMDNGSQHTEDGKLCSECHEIYTISYDTEEWGSVGVKYTKTGEWVTDYKEMNWL